jgi:hypothetical protein
LGLSLPHAEQTKTERGMDPAYGHYPTTNPGPAGPVTPA